MHDLQPRTRRAITAAAVVASSAVLALVYGVPYGTYNQLTYMLEPLRLANPALYRHDWLISSTTQYHPLFGWMIAPLYRLDASPELVFGIAQLVVMTATFAVIYRLIAALADRARLAMFVLVIGLLALGGGRTLAGSYLFAGYLQPLSLSTLGWLLAMLAWVRGQPWRAGVWLAISGAFHVNILLLGIGLFAAVQLTAGGDLRRRLTGLVPVLGPSLLVLAAFLPALLASAHARDMDATLRILTRFHAPGHYDPKRVLRWLPPLIAWLVVAWGALPWARTANREAVDRLWRFAAVTTLVCVAATVIVWIPHGLTFTRLRVWRISPFAQLACQLIIVVAAFTPAAAASSPSSSPSSPPRPSRGRALAVGLGALAVGFWSVRLGGGRYLYPAAVGLVAAAWLAARSLRLPVVAAGVAAATFVVAVAVRRGALIDPPLFGPGADQTEIDVARWAKTATPVDAVFLAPPYAAWFRLLGERAVVADTKSPPLYPDELIEWYQRLCAMVDAPEMPTWESVEARWDTLTADQVAAAARRFAVDYVLLYKRSPARLAAPVAFETGDHLVYRVR